MILYKYRTFDNWKYFVDIIENERLYAAKYNELNDPMEGHYRSVGLTDEQINTLLKTKMDENICSLSLCNKDIGLWVFYAKEGRGCCIEVELDMADMYNTVDRWHIKPVDYRDDLPEINIYDIEDYGNVKNILYSKLARWQGEREYRCTKYSDKYMPVKIKRITLGYNVEESNKTLVNAYVDSVNRKRFDKIIVDQIDKEQLAQMWCKCSKVEDCIKCRENGICPMEQSTFNVMSAPPSLF